MKVYIAVDMEGGTGICSPDQCARGNPAYEEGRRLITGDVNAAVEGALAGGATEVIVADMHSGSFNLLLEAMHPAAQVLWGVPHSGPRYAFLDGSVDAMFLVGYHARAGTPHAVLEHTMSSAGWFRVVINGREIGEVGIDAALAGAVGVPVVLVTGDDKVCLEARELLGPIETAVVKRGVARQRGLCLSPERTHDVIREAAQRALQLTHRITPLSFGTNVEVALTYKHTEHADGVQAPERVDGYTVVRRYAEFADWFGGVWHGGA